MYMQMIYYSIIYNDSIRMVIKNAIIRIDTMVIIMMSCVIIVAHKI